MSQQVSQTSGRAVQTEYRVGLMGAPLDTGNRGVSALGSSLVSLISHARPDAAISLLIGSRDARRTEVRVGSGFRTVSTVNYRLSPRASLGQQLWWILLLSLLYRVIPSVGARRRIARTNAWVRYVAQADFIGDIRGGDSFSDIYGGREFILGCLPVLSVIWIRGSIHLFPQTYGPFRSWLPKQFARYILLRAATIWCRDRMSLDEISALTKSRRQGSLSHDVAFALEAIRPEALAVDPPIRVENQSTLIGVNVNGLMYNGGYTRANMFGLRLDYREFLKKLLEKLLSDDLNRVLLVPHTFAAEGRVESDPAASRDLIRALPPSLQSRIHLVVGEHDQHRIKAVIGMCDFFIGSRMHACIAALSQGIPTVAVAYSRKFAGVFETVGAADWVIDGRTQSEDEALNRVAVLFENRLRSQADLEAGAAAAQDQLFRTFKRVLGECAGPMASGALSAVRSS